MPGVNDEVAKLAVPAFSVAAARMFPLAMKLTLPVGVPPSLVTFAEMVIAVPTSAGLGETVTAVVVVASDTVSETGPEVLPLSLASPV